MCVFEQYKGQESSPRVWETWGEEEGTKLRAVSPLNLEGYSSVGWTNIPKKELSRRRDRTEPSGTASMEAAGDRQLQAAG